MHDLSLRQWKALMRLPVLLLVAFRVGRACSVSDRHAQVFVDLFFNMSTDKQDELIGQVAIGVLQEFKDIYNSIQHLNLAEFRMACYEDLSWIEGALPTEQLKLYLSLLIRLFEELDATDTKVSQIKTWMFGSRGSSQLQSFLLGLIQDKIQLDR